jgi:hypothetical protein
MVLFAALLSGAPFPAAAPFHAALAPTAPDLGTAARFAVLGGPAVTLTDSIVKGDVGVNTGTAVTLTGSTIFGTIHAGDAVAQQAYSDFLLAYAALALTQCDVNLTGQPLSGKTLTPGVYCFDAAVTETGGVLTLDPQGSPNAVWIFKIGTFGTGALTATNFSVVVAGGGDPCSVAPNVFWWTAEAATLSYSDFLGSILAGAAITVTGGSLDGQALAKAAVTLTGANVAVCGTFKPPFPPFPPGPAIKVTGGGQIPVPNPYSKGRATFGFNAQPDKKDGAKGNLNYVNHVTGLHVNGAVTSIYLIAVNPDGSPKTVLFSGTWEGGSFFVTVEDHGERGSDDQFGITVTTATDELIEVMSQRVISNGNIQFHK